MSAKNVKNPKKRKIQGLIQLKTLANKNTNKKDTYKELEMLL